MEKELIEIKADISAMKTEIKHLNINIVKLEELLKSVTVIMEKQHTLGERVLKLEENYEKMRLRVRALEDWRLMIVAGAWVVGAIVSFILNKIF